MKRVRCTSVVLLAVIGFLMGVADAPLPARLAGSKARCDQAMKAARVTYLKAELAAKQAYLKDVKTALIDATKLTHLDEANAINVIKGDVESDLEDLKLMIDGGGDKTVVKVAANQGWQKALAVHQGDTLIFKALGTWCSAVPARAECTTDADGVSKQKNDDFITGTPYAALIAEIDSQQFVVGRRATIRAEHDGDLKMRINDKGIDDNDGELTVTIIQRSK